MTTYAKLKDGALEVLRRVPHHSNPSEATIKAYAEANGYKTYVKVEQPGEYFDHGYAETETSITDVWTEWDDARKATAVVAAYTEKIQQWMDEEAQKHGYDGILSAASYAGDPDARYNAEGTACRAWRSAVWRAALDYSERVIAGKEPLISVEELIAKMPQMQWPEV